MAIAGLFFLFGLGIAIKQDPVLPIYGTELPIHGHDFTVSRLPLTGDPMPMSDLKVADHIITLKRGNAKSLSSMFVQAMRSNSMDAGSPQRNPTTGEAPLIAVEAGQVFLAPVTVGGQIFDVVIDTGSSDPWLVTPNFTCIDPYSGDTQAQTDCYFGTAYNPNQSSTYQPIPTENFNISYADQELLNGDMGYETFTFGGITVPHQKFGLVDYAGWYGDGYSSGLIGFAYGTLTSAYNGTDPSKDVRGGTLLYNPLFVSMYNLSLIAPIFSMAINRDPNDGGLLALGGIPDIPHSPCWISTAIQSVGFFIGTNTPAYEFYTVEINGFAFSASQYTQFDVLGTGNPAKTPIIEPASVIVDSGTSLVYAPNDVARGVALGFRPPAVFDSDTGAWYVACNATPPTFGVSIGHKIFFANGQDLIIPSSGGHCISGVQPKNDGLTILGDVWMKNVITVFDIGAAMMRFAAREYYSLNYARIQVTT